MYAVLLSQGEYSDYSPTYFIGPRYLGQEELNQNAVRIGDELRAWWRTLTVKDYGMREDEDGRVVWAAEVGTRWWARMEAWLASEGFEKVETDVSINVCYNDIPGTSQEGDDL
jgi:hypothetical protein